MKYTNLLTLLILIILCSCNGHYEMDDSKSQSQDEIQEVKYSDFSIQTLCSGLKKDSITVLFHNTKNAASKEQLELLKQIQARQEQISREIVTEIFKYYKSARKDYENGVLIAEGEAGNKSSKEELESILPTAKSKEYLQKFYSIEVIHVPEKVNLLEPEFVLEFDCDWDIENGLALKYKNWKPIATGTAEMNFFEN